MKHEEEKYTKETTRIDWNRLWKETYVDKHLEDNLKFWDDFAPRFRKKLTEPEKDQYYVRVEE